jgi:predicted DNA-binding transcriptional regulator AlpA
MNATKSRSQSLILPPGVDALLDKAQVCAAVGVCRRTLDGMISAGEFPGADTTIASGRRWRVSTFNAWVEARCKRG